MRAINRLFYAAAMLAVFGTGLLTGCQKEDGNLARAVLASAASMVFAGEDALPQTITVYSDAQWTAEVPEWITIEPETGSGTTEVTVSVTDNVRDGALDNPRTAELVFKGSTLDSRDIVVVTQEGDKYRDVKNYTVTELVAATDGTVVIVPDAHVVAVSSRGFIVSDGSSNIYVEDGTAAVEVGDDVSFRGEKSSSMDLPSVSDLDMLEVTGTSETVYPEARDITSSVDTYSSDRIEYVTVSGVLENTNVRIEGASFSVSVQDAPESFGIADLNGHNVTVSGYFSGLAEPYVNVILTEVTDNGVNEVIYFQDDFSWLQEYVDACETAGSPVSSSVEDKDTGSSGARNIYTFGILTDMGLLEDLRGRGYIDLNPDMKTIYLQKCYFKFGATDKQSGLTLPPFAEGVFSSESEDIVVSFQWCEHVGGSGNPDDAEMVVEIQGPGTVEDAQDADGKLSIPFTTTQTENENDPQFYWMDASVKIAGVTEETRITIRPAWTGGAGGPSKYMRYYLDNIKIVPAE